MSEPTKQKPDHQNDPRSVEELVATALIATDEELAWRAILSLHYRGTGEVFERARSLCESSNPKERELGVDILGQLGVPQRTFPEECLQTILGILETEDNIEVVASCGIALGHLHDPRAVEPLVRLKDHRDKRIRYSAVFGLLGYEDSRAIQALVELSQDEDSDVRDWATFGIGQMIDTDIGEIRDALFQRVGDEDNDTRAEALFGLARRHDERVFKPLLRKLTSESVGSLVVEAAKELGDPRLYPALVELQEWWDVDPELLKEAIETCRPGTS